ncbi:hypothetical protein BDW42DRAFT_95189 [Aspergillus taichungensis]|uniref:Uncharacterized protein n=1 Tax=Aspergillus taichungensis TaxID=482145 RepID=A0A2J5HVZ6_9EURO|nr:hypothetical protein BDW42DRAFT_95189 [Aspergillus taichungensis]
MYVLLALVLGGLSPRRASYLRLRPHRLSGERACSSVSRHTSGEHRQTLLLDVSGIEFYILKIVGVGKRGRYGKTTRLIPASSQICDYETIYGTCVVDNRVGDHDWGRQGALFSYLRDFVSVSVSVQFPI